MSKQDITKEAFARTFKQLLKEKQFDKIHARDIINASGFSNKTFYYHFKDKQDLAIWIFHTEIEQVISNITNDSYISSSDVKMRRDPTFGKPFYLELSNLTESLFSKYLRAFQEYYYENRDFYIGLFKSSCQNNLRHHLLDLYHQQFRENIRLIFCHKNIDVQAFSYKIELLAVYFAHAFVGALIYWIKSGMKDYQSESTKTDLLLMTEKCMKFVIDILYENNELVEAVEV